MVWGATLLERGVRFRLWAPSVHQVTLMLGEAEAAGPRPMEPVADGWWQLDVPEAGPGWRYRFRVADDLAVPDPASRYQPDGPHGASTVVDPGHYRWQVPEWTGRPWHEAVVYELHVGTFTAGGTFRAAIDKLDLLAELGVTAVELMPVAEFPGGRNWGYDGVLPFAPDSSYGTPEDLKALVDAAHQRGLMILLDVVYNHFGPEGNYLGQYAEPFFTSRHRTPWGDAINFDTGPGDSEVRTFFIDNALYWLDEYRFDGLRLDAVHAIEDDSAEHVLTELARRVRQGPGSRRHVHLVLENDRNEAHRLAPDDSGAYRAQWNDDFHHALHVALTGECDSYYGDYAEAPVARLARTLAQGFDYQGEHSPHRDAARGEPSAALAPTAFVAFLQNHDQVGNRALGERIHELTEPRALRAATELLLLNPMPPLLFMGQEWCASSPFPFFCDFDEGLAEAVRRGRLEEFSRFAALRDPAALERIPDPVSEATFEAARLRWDERLAGEHGEWWRLHHDLLALRRLHVVPLLARPPAAPADYRLFDDCALEVRWHLAGGVRYTVQANLGEEPRSRPPAAGQRLYATPGVGPRPDDPLPPWCTVFVLEREGDGGGAAS